MAAVLLGVYGHICWSLLGLLQNGRQVLVCALANGIRDMVVNDGTHRRFATSVTFDMTFGSYLTNS
jgi:hypothetical protein